MSNIVTSLRERINKRAAYHRTVEELRAIPLEVALDLDIYPGDAERIAYETVYGQNHMRPVPRGGGRQVAA